MEEEITLSKVERLMISNQLKILKILDPHESEYYETRSRALDEGYELHFDELFDHIYDVFPREECKWVLRVLQMHRFMWYAWEKHKPDDIEKTRVMFAGFDGNNETSYYGYARYFIEGLGRYQELKDNLRYGELNSHMPTLERYRRMLDAWDKVEDKYDLTVDELRSIVESQTVR